jgi:protein TonB
MNPTSNLRGSTTGGVIGVLCILALAVLAGLWVNKDRNRLLEEIEILRSDFAAAETRGGELQKQLDAERVAREQAEAKVEETAAAAAQVRQELQNQQAKLGGRIQELEAGIQETEQQVASAVDARTKAETELMRQAGLRKAAEQAATDLREQLQQQEALVSQMQGSTGTSTGLGPGAGARAASTVAATEPESRAAFDTPPRPLDLVTPEYPNALRQQGAEGHVVVAFTVDTQGRVEGVEVQESTNREFETAAVVAVQKWRFKPALRDGEPVKVRLSQRVEFTSG